MAPMFEARLGADRVGLVEEVIEIANSCEPDRVVDPVFLRSEVINRHVRRSAR